MIDKREIIDTATALGLTPHVVEKDYVLGWLRRPESSFRWTLGGSTCTRIRVAGRAARRVSATAVRCRHAEGTYRESSSISPRTSGSCSRRCNHPSSILTATNRREGSSSGPTPMKRRSGRRSELLPSGLGLGICTRGKHHSACSQPGQGRTAQLPSGPNRGRKRHRRDVQSAVRDRADTRGAPRYRTHAQRRKFWSRTNWHHDNENDSGAVGGRPPQKWIGLSKRTDVCLPVRLLWKAVLTQEAGVLAQPP